jgi:VIT1/CCC1 family predicted Fe2+/Mn2+ transporter
MQSGMGHYRRFVLAPSAPRQSSGVSHVVIPFIFLREPRLALRISNAIAIIMLFMAGCAFCRYAADHPWRIRIAMVLLGALMVAISIVLGG